MIVFCCFLPASNKARDDDDDYDFLRQSCLMSKKRLSLNVGKLEKLFLDPDPDQS